jgi:Zn-dependent protease
VPTIDFRDNLLTFIPMLLSLTVHEWAHAISAYYFGDDTAAREGRLTLNPIAHIDPIGTLLLPLLGVRFGWAKPVPVVPSRFRRDVRMSTGMMITAAAGPVSNLVLAFLCVLGLALALRFQPELYAQQEALYTLLQRGAGINIGLAVFNALPIPPLDGSRIAEHYVPYRHRSSWESFVRLAPMILLVIIVFPGRLAFIDGPMNFVEGTIVRTAMWMVGLT